MSAYEELVERCMVIDAKAPITAILAEVLRTLGTVTPEMDKEGLVLGDQRDHLAIWHAMLRASPITPPS